MTQQLSDDSGRRVQAVRTSCRILETLRTEESMGVSDLASRLDQSKATVYHHLHTLLDEEFVVKQDEEYSLSLKFVDFGEYAKEKLRNYDMVKEQVEKLSEKTGEVANFMVEEHGRGVYMAKSRGEDAIHTASYVGNRKDLHCTALGKAILSRFSDDRIDEIIDARGLDAHTENTITTRDELFEELETIREEGIAFDNEEVLDGLRCVAAPVDHPSVDTQGAISIAGPTSRFKGERFREELPELVQSAANVIEVNSVQA